MNQKELVDAIKENVISHYDAGVSKVVIEAVLATLADVVAREIQQGEGAEVVLPGIGKISVQQRAARIGRNPATGEEMQIAAKNVPHFSAAKALKGAAMCN